MQRVLVAPINAADLPVVLSKSGAARRVLQANDSTGGSTFLFDLPAGWRSPYANGKFEHHTAHEEIVNLHGTLQFGRWYDFVGPGYLNHPPHWVHPSDESTDTGVRLLVKMSGPTDFFFEDIPPDWDGAEFVAREPNGPSPYRGVSFQPLDPLPWEPVLYQDLTPTGYEAKTIWQDPVSGWTTWMMRVPAGWRGNGMRRSMPGGDELFLIEGDLTAPRDPATRLTAGSYYCDPDRFTDGGMTQTSEHGCVAVRWTKTPNYLLLPSIRY